MGNVKEGHSLVQSNNASFPDRLQSCMLNTLPLSRNQMILSLNVANTQQILEAQLVGE